MKSIPIHLCFTSNIYSISDEMKGTLNYIGIDSTNDVKGEIFRGGNV